MHYLTIFWLCSLRLTALPVLTGLALVDCSASSETIGLLSEVVNLDGCVVLANKKPVTSPLVT